MYLLSHFLCVCVYLQDYSHTVSDRVQLSSSNISSSWGRSGEVSGRGAGGGAGKGGLHRSHQRHYRHADDMSVSADRSGPRSDGQIDVYYDEDVINAHDNVHDNAGRGGGVDMMRTNSRPNSRPQSGEHPR